MIGGLLADVWLLFGRMFPLPTTPGLRAVGRPDSSSPVLVTCNFDLTVRKVTRTLERDGVDAWLLVAPTRGINVWCAAGGGHFTTDTVVSILETSGIAERVDHRRLILPQLAGTGVSVWSLAERTGWKPRFGPVRIEDLAGYLRRGRRLTEPAERRVGFGLRDRLVMGTNLAFSSLVFFIVPLLVASIWLGGFWWKSIVLIFALAVLDSVLVFRLPGMPGVQKGFALGVLVAALFAATSSLAWGMSAGSTALWAGWIVFLATYLGYDLPSWSPLWRADLKELALGKRHTHIAIDEDACIGCHLCAVVCPVAVFARDPGTRKYSVADLAACQACGACVENCPADAIVTNFRSGLCACPLCAAIKGVGALKAKTRREEEAMTENQDAGKTCCGGGGVPSPEGAGPESSSATCGCEPSRACGCGPSPGGMRVKRRLVILAMVAAAVAAVLWLKPRAEGDSRVLDAPASSPQGAARSAAAGPAESGPARTTTVLLFADPRETDEDCGCADIARLVGGLRSVPGVGVREFDVRHAGEEARRYAVRVSPSVIILGPDGKERARFEGESEATIEALRVALAALSPSPGAAAGDGGR